MADFTQICSVLPLGRFRVCKSVAALTDFFMVLLQGPAQAQNLRDSLVEAKSDIVVKVSYSHVPPALDMELSFYCVLSENQLGCGAV